MNYRTIEVKCASGITTLTMNRPEHRNSLNRELISELTVALRECSTDADSRMIVFAGKGQFFCTGMDFQELANPGSDSNDTITHEYMNLLREISLLPKIVVSRVDGEVMAGGVGIVAASDLVIASPKSQFSLSEALWGLLPACVTPYLIRRVGFQTAFRMTLTTMPINAEEAKRVNLVDELTDNPDDAVRKLYLRVSRLEGTTIANIKNYFRRMWIISQDMEDAAVKETSRLMQDPQVLGNIRTFLDHKKFPWDKTP
jgi:polyketide biosynthesis enoyl-CoA hydratase PksH